MSKLRRPNEIWTLKPTPADLAEGARYAAISLPWTFNRMMHNTGSFGQQQRAFNIAKGIVGQEVLRRALDARGVKSEVQRKSHRNDDLFDLRVSVDGSLTRLDLKSWNYYSNYEPLGRQPLSPDLIIKHAAYPGPDWRQFFPMLVPHTQILQDKELYCFAAASSIDFRRDPTTDRSSEVLAAFPFGELLPFLSSKKLCLAREAAEEGIYLSLTWRPEGMFNPKALSLNVVGEWDGEHCTTDATLRPNKATVVGPFSCVASFKIDPKSFHEWNGGNIVINISKNDFTAPVLNSTRKNDNVQPRESLVLGRSDFCNLVLPTNYALYVIGWITKAGFIDACPKHPPWVWPLDSENKFENQAWAQITENDEKAITRAGFGHCLHRERPRFRAGWMKTTGKGGGACCYVYPNIGRMGGIRETNLYVLPGDLETMETLG